MSRRTVNRLRAIAVGAASIVAVVLGALTGHRPQLPPRSRRSPTSAPIRAGRGCLYVPASVKPNPAVVVGVHWCHGTAQDFYGGTSYASLADQYGFIVIYPSAPRSGMLGRPSTAALRHDGGSDPLGIVSMVSCVHKQR